MTDQTLVSVLQGSPSAPATVVGSGGSTVTRGQLLSLAQQFAQSLRASGIRPGDVVTIVDANTVEFAVAFLGTTFARAVAAPLNQNYCKDEFAFYMEDAGSKLLVVGPSGYPAAEEAGVAPVISIKLDFSGAEPRLELGTKGTGVELHVAPAGQGLADAPQPDDVALFLHTSGTTSRPKGVPLTQANLLASLSNIRSTYEFTDKDVSLLVMPLFHVHGLMAGFLAPLSAGATIVFPAEGRFAASTFWADAVAHGVTFYTAVPTMHQILVSRASKDYPTATPPPLRVIRSCSSSLAPATLAALERAFGAPVLEAYAMTEASHQMTSNPLPHHGEHRAGTVGKAQGSVRVGILSPDNKVLGPGEEGEVCIQGPNVTHGYRNNPGANEEAFAGGWFHTGDQGKLDAEGYLTLTGRIKELINRGGEKISPIEVDGALLSHPGVAEAVSFGAPDEKYGESVAAAVVLNEEGKALADPVSDIQRHVSTKLAKFKVPTQVFITDALPKTATGKIQRRFMVDAFITGPAAQQQNKGAESAGAGSSLDLDALPNNAYFVIAKTLRALGVKAVYGVVGIPITQLASCLQAVGIRFISFRNEQAAGYAAGAAGYLTGIPGVMVTVSGPGVVHALAGLSNAQINTWPMVLISGSCETGERGKGAFQELDQVAAAAPYTKYAARVAGPAELPSTLATAFEAAVAGRAGAAYVDVPSDILQGPGLEVPGSPALSTLLPSGPLKASYPAPTGDAVAAAADLLASAKSPLVVVGKGAAWARAEGPIRELVSAAGLPVLSTAMGRGVVSDSYALSVNAARSAALAGADVVLVFGARLNWQLHFGEAPRWRRDVAFVLVDPEPSARDVDVAKLVVRADAGAGAAALTAALAAKGIDGGAWRDDWTRPLAERAGNAKTKLTARLSAAAAVPMDYPTALGVVRRALAATTPAPLVVAEGANTLDNSRLFLEPVTAPRLRLDAGTWGTMGVGLGYAIAAAVTDPTRRVVAMEGDSAFGFSGMEVETIVRYALPITVVILNNGGIYGGDRREQPLRDAAAAGLAAAGFPHDPVPTDFTPVSRYDQLATAFGGQGVKVDTPEELERALAEALQFSGPTLINVTIDPQAGVESGNVHAFNFKAPEK